jgi:hypothetical protein
LDVKVDEEQARKEGTKKNSQVSTELNLQGESGRRKSVDDGVHSEGRGGNGDSRDASGGSLEGGLGDCDVNRKDDELLDIAAFIERRIRSNERRSKPRLISPREPCPASNGT